MANLAVDARNVGLSPAHGPDILGDISLAVKEGEFVAIIGPSGCDELALFDRK